MQHWQPTGFPLGLCFDDCVRVTGMCVHVCMSACRTSLQCQAVRLLIYPWDAVALCMSSTGLQLLGVNNGTVPRPPPPPVIMTTPVPSLTDNITNVMYALSTD